MRIFASFLLFTFLAWSQCAMCFRTAESQTRARAEALNKGIAIMLIPLGVAAGAIAYLAYRRRDTWAMLQTKRMNDDPIIRKYTNFDEMKADEYRYWQSRPVHERMDAVEEMIQAAYALKGWKIEPDVPRLQRPFVRLPCPWR